MSAIHIHHEQQNDKGKFRALLDGETVGLMTYTLAPRTIIIDHTERAESVKGQGVGKMLVNAGVGFARENQFKVLPLCPFAANVFHRTPEFEDVWRNEKF